MIINGNKYVTARPEDFILHAEAFSSHNELRYVGEHEYVYIDSFESITEGKKPRNNGYISKTYNSMFKGTSVKGVASSGAGFTSGRTRGMFEETTSETLDLTGFNTAGIRDMTNMFKNSAALILVINKLNTSSVEFMDGMFEGSKAISLDLRNFDTSNVSNMERMFMHSEAKRLDLTTFNTSKVVNFRGMFGGSHAEELDLANFDTTGGQGITSVSARNGMASMFANSKAKKINLGSFDTSGVMNMYFMFANAEVEEIKVNTFTMYEGVSGRNGYPGVDISGAFSGTKLKTLDLSSWDIGKIRDFEAFNTFLDSTIETVYVKDRDARNRLRNMNGNPSGIEFIVGGEGYIEPEVRPPAPLQDPGSSGIERIEEGERTTAPIKFKTVKIINREWKDGKEEVIQEGVDGYRVTRNYTIYYVDGTTEKGSDTSIEPPIDEIIEYGTIVSEETERREEVYEHETETYNDYELNYPQERVQQRGENGYFKQTVKVITHSDGYVEEIIDEKKTERKDPVTEIIAIGMIERKSTITETEEIPFEIDTTYDYELAYNDGEPHIEERGKEGSIRRTFEITVYVDDTPDLKVEHPEKRTETPPEKQTQKIGLIDYITEEEEERVIEFDVAYEYTKDLLEGEERLKQQGENGYESRNYEVTYYVAHPLTAVQKAPVREEIKEDYEYEAPTTHIIEIGTQEAVVDVRDDVINKVVRFETEYIDDATLYEGQEVISRQGVDGSSEEKWQIIEYFDGTTERHHVYTEVIEPINQIVRRGTKDPVVNSYEETKTETLTYETVRISTNDLPDGEEEVAREGLDGTITVTYRVSEFYDGRVEREPVKEVRRDAQHEIIKVGTNTVIVRQEQERDVEILEFETEYVDDDTLYIGEQRIETEGKNGHIENIYIVTEFETGQVERVLVGTSTVDPITQVILVGTKRETAEEELINIKRLGRKHKGGFLYLEDGDKTIRATTKTKIRPLWGYL